MTDGVRCMLMRGGSSKGAYFLASDLPTDPAERDELLLRIMGTPDERQIDGLGGAHPLTSKVAVVSASPEPDVDIDYLFLQLGVGERMVTDRQNCGNILAGIAPFAIARGLLSPADGPTTVRIRMTNFDSRVTASFEVANGQAVVEGSTAISGVPGTAAPIRLDFEDVAGSSTGALLATGHLVDDVDGVECTLVDNGMPVVVFAASDVGVSGSESCADLESNTTLRSRLEELRAAAALLMGLGDVSKATVPKMTMVAAPTDGGHLLTRTFIPHRCHDAIGVLGAVSVATAAVLDGSPAHRLSTATDGTIVLEHPTGTFEAVIDASFEDGEPVIERAGIIRTARPIMDGIVFPRPYA